MFERPVNFPWYTRRRLDLTRSRYLSTSSQTQNPFDSEGWYRTGDIARREGDFYFILGRASIDSKHKLSRL